MADQDNECRQDLRTEYTALSSYFNTVIGFRFTTLSFYLAAVGLICKDGLLTDSKAFLLILVTLPVYLIQIRNGTLYENLSTRARQIEKGWGGENARFFEHMMKPVPKDKPGIFGGQVRFHFSITHGFAMDMLFIGMLFYALFSIAYNHDMVRVCCGCFGFRLPIEHTRIESGFISQI